MHWLMVYCCSTDLYSQTAMTEDVNNYSKIASLVSKSI